MRPREGQLPRHARVSPTRSLQFLERPRGPARQLPGGRSRSAEALQPALLLAARMGAQPGGHGRFPGAVRAQRGRRSRETVREPGRTRMQAWVPAKKIPGEGCEQGDGTPPAHRCPLEEVVASHARVRSWAAGGEHSLCSPASVHAGCPRAPARLGRLQAPSLRPVPRAAVTVPAGPGCLRGPRDAGSTVSPRPLAPALPWGQAAAHLPLRQDTPGAQHPPGHRDNLPCPPPPPRLSLWSNPRWPCFTDGDTCGCQDLTRFSGGLRAADLPTSFPDSRSRGPGPSSGLSAGSPGPGSTLVSDAHPLAPPDAPDAPRTVLTGLPASSVGRSPPAVRCSCSSRSSAAWGPGGLGQISETASFHLPPRLRLPEGQVRVSMRLPPRHTWCPAHARRAPSSAPRKGRHVE